MDNQEATNANNAQAFNFLTEIYDVMKCFENNPSKLSNKINELKSKFDKSRTILTTMPGIDMSLIEQEEYYESLLKKYKKDKELLVSYKDICNFDISKLEQGPTESFLSSSKRSTQPTIDDSIRVEQSLQQQDSAAQFDLASFKTNTL